MMIKFLFLLPAVVAVSLNAFSFASDKTPTADDFLALDKQTIEAHMHGDGAFFERTLSDKIVIPDGGGGRMNRAEAVKMISGEQCSIKDGWSLTQPVFQKISADAYVLTYLLTEDGTCTLQGMKVAQPSPTRASTVWVKSGDRWQIAFHGENTIVDPKTMAKDSTLVDAAQPDMAKGGSADAYTNALMVAENAIWDAWKDKDAKRLAALTAADISFVNIFGEAFANKADAIKSWTGDICEVKRVSLSHGTGTLIAPSVAILTVTGSIDGNCGGTKSLPVYAASVYVKQGETWKWTFGFNSTQ